MKSEAIHIWADALAATVARKHDKYQFVVGYSLGPMDREPGWYFACVTGIRTESQNSFRSAEDALQAAHTYIEGMP